MSELDAVDRAILAALQDDARLSNRDLAAAVGVSPSTSSERVRNLRTRGVIDGFHASVDLSALGRQVQALIAVKIRPPSRQILADFRDWAATMPQTLAVFALSGTDDFLIHVAVPGTDDLYAFVIDQLANRREVADVRTAIVYEQLHRRRIDPYPEPAKPRRGRPSRKPTADSGRD